MNRIINNKFQTSIYVSIFCLLVSFSIPLKAQITINEILASNSKTNQDSDMQQYSDWIELYNAGTETINLEGYFLTDDLTISTKWQFPSGISIQSGGYLLVWADAENMNATAIHTNFKLEKNSGQIGLYTRENSMVDTLNYGYQLKNFSYGRKPDGTSSWLYFSTPSPNSANSQSGTENIVDAPEFSQNGGYYYDNLSITLSTKIQNATIRYTLDGSDPTLSSQIFSSSINITNTTLVKAKTFKDNALSSPIIAHTFFIDKKNINISLPVIVINTIGETIRDEPRVNVHMAVIMDGKDKGNEYDGDIAIEIRGSSSQRFDKKQYSVETRQSDGENKNVSLLGLPAENDWILYAPFTDKSLMRNVLTYKLATDMGWYAPRTKFCELYINNNYKGVYVLVEKIKKDKNRVNIEDLLPTHNSEPEITGGYLIKKDRGNSLIKTLSGASFVPEYPSETEITQTQINWIQDYLNDFENQLFQHNTAYTDYIDITSFIDNYILVEALKNIDGYRLSTFFTKPRNGKLQANPIWDYNLSMGNANYSNGGDPTGWYMDALNNNEEYLYWWNDLRDDEHFMTECKKRWKELRKYELNTTRVFSLIDNYMLELNGAWQRNYIRWPILGEYVWPNYFIGDTYESEIEFMKQFIETRFSWIDQQWNLETIELSFDAPETGNLMFNNINIPNKNFSISYVADASIELIATPALGYKFTQWEITSVNNSKLQLIRKNQEWKYNDNGSLPSNIWNTTNYDDNNWKIGSAQLGYGDNDEATIIDYGNDDQNKYTTTYFRKEFILEDISEINKLTLNILRDDGAVVYINDTEVIRSNMPDGEIDYSTFATTYVGDEDENIYFQYTLPVNILINGKNIIAVEIHQSNLTSSDFSFDLELITDKDITLGEVEIFKDTILNKTFVESKKIKAVFEQIEDIPQLFINEFMAVNNSTITDNYDEYDDWIEIYNPSDEAVDLGGYYITDDMSIPLKWEIPTDKPLETTIAANGYLILWADQSPEQGALHVDFKLNSNGEYIGLYYKSAITSGYLDSIRYNRQMDDASTGRLPDGNEIWQLFDVSTPNARNEISVSIMENNSISNNFMSQNYPNPFNGNTQINFSIVNEQFVQISVYDISGKLVNNLVSAKLPSGDHSINWDANKSNYGYLKNGIYLIRMETNGLSTIKKAVLLR